MLKYYLINKKINRIYINMELNCFNLTKNLIINK